MAKIISNTDFYNELAGDYDDMISFNKAVEKKKNILKNFIDRNTRNVADVGCGSGVDSIAFSNLNMNVDAFDPSIEMIKIAETNSKKMNSKIVTHNYQADKIPNEFNNKFDLVISLGNTFSNIPNDLFPNSLKRCYEILKTEGRVVIQILNYKKIIENKERIINVTESENKIFVRFYDFYEEQIVFNILTLNKKNLSERKLCSTQIYPYLIDNFKKGLSAAGFSQVKFFGDLKLSEYLESQSSNLVIIAIKK